MQILELENGHFEDDDEDEDDDDVIGDGGLE